MMMERMQPWQPLGKHLIRTQDDVVFVRAQGEVTGPEIIALCEEVLRVQNQFGWAFEIVDARAAGMMSAEARQQNAAWLRQNPLDVEVAVFGANLIWRTIFSLMSNALRLLSSSQPLLHLVATEAEAWAWVDQRRRLRRPPAGRS
jgi:hypothetical protein